MRGGGSQSKQGVVGGVARVRRSKRGQSSHRVSLKLSSDVCRGQGFGDLTGGRHRGGVSAAHS